MSESRTEAEPAPDIPFFRHSEERFRRWLVFPFYIFLAELTAREFSEFQPLYEQLGEELLSWKAKRDKRCSRVCIHARIHPWIAGRVRDYLRKMRASDSHAFLRSIPLEVKLQGLDDKPVDDFILEPDAPDG